MSTTTTTKLDVTRIRADFPILQRRVHGKPLVYLDNAATTQKPRQVLDALVRFYSQTNANIHRGIHALAEEATQAYEHTRLEVGRFINAPAARSIIFTRNTTESINLVANAWGRANLRPGDQILLTELEHHSNLVPWQLIAQATGAELAFVGITDDGRLRMDEFAAKLTPRTRLVGITHMSNALGTINPVQEMTRQAKAAGALVLIDAAQSVSNMPVDVQQIGCDFLAFSAHKMLGPTGVGVLYGREEILEAMPPFLGGGEMIADVKLSGSTWNELPWKFEAGTPNIADVAAFAEALAYLQRLGMDAVLEHERELTAYALKRLREVDGITLYGPTDPRQRGGVVSLNLDGLHPHDVGTLLDGEGIAVRAGHHCAKPVMKRLNLAATVRASFYIYNTADEVDRLVDGLRAARAFFGRPKGT
jgi:cysteine desulfurase/selenocysteine lyase